MLNLLFNYIEFRNQGLTIKNSTSSSGIQWIITNAKNRQVFFKNYWKQ